MENSLLLPPVGVWTVLSSSQADHPLRPATDRRLGALLPHQLANRTQAAPKAPSTYDTDNGLRHYDHKFAKIYLLDSHLLTVKVR